MDPILYNAAGGGRANFSRQEIIANNLANAATPGFRTDLYQAQTMYAQGGGSNSSGNSFVVQNTNSFDLTGGDLITTGRNLDVAINGNGWLAVRGSSGKEAYTKTGSLHLDPNGQLVTASGKAVIGNGGPISIPPAQSINIGTDGTISIVAQGDTTQSPAVIDRVKMVSLPKDNIVKNADGLFQLKTGGVAPFDSNVRLLSGALEGSNVQPVEQMVAMITAGRDFEAQMNLMTTVSDNSQKLAQVLHD